MKFFSLCCVPIYSSLLTELLSFDRLSSHFFLFLMDRAKRATTRSSRFRSAAEAAASSSTAHNSPKALSPATSNPLTRNSHSLTTEKTSKSDTLKTNSSKKKSFASTSDSSNTSHKRKNAPEVTSPPSRRRRLIDDAEEEQLARQEQEERDAFIEEERFLLQQLPGPSSDDGKSDQGGPLSTSEDEPSEYEDDSNAEKTSPHQPLLASANLDEELDELMLDDLPDLDVLPASVKVSLHFRRGKPLGKLRSIRDWPIPSWSHSKDEGYGFLIGRITNHVTTLRGMKPENAGLVWSPAEPYVQPTNSTKQKGYQRIDDETYEKVIARAWHAEKKRLGDDSQASVKIFVYLMDTSDRGMTVKRQSKKRIEEANMRILEAQTAGRLLNVGKFTAAVMARDEALRTTATPAEEDLPIRNNALYNQAQRLDERARQLSEDQAQRSTETRDIQTIRVQLVGDQWIQVPIDIAQLRRALGLPPALPLVDLLQRPMDPPPAPSANMADICHNSHNHTIVQDEEDE